MKKLALTAAVLAASIRLALAADPAALSVVVFEQGKPVADAQVLVDGESRGRTGRDGILRLSVPVGSRELVLRQGEREVLRLDLDFVEGENAELIASLQADRPTHVQYESSEAGRPQQVQTETPAGPPGTLSGRVTSSDGDSPVAGARVYISGTPLDIRTDAEGRYSAEVPAGSYSISVIAAEFDTRTLDGIEIAAESVTSRDIEITPAGLELPEFVVLEPYVEGALASLVEERRESASVADFLGAEQISRAGDSDVAGALKRVTGLTLVDGKYVYVRGLGERYSSVLLNGAPIPSPDPTRRVVPLDLFPTEVIESIEVQKTYSGERPGDFGGGTIELRTRGAPDSLLAKLGITVGYLDGTTGADGLAYDGGSHDWTGYDNRRRLQGGIAEAVAAGPLLTVSNYPREQLAGYGRDLAGSSVYTPFEKRIEPAYGFAGGFGYGWDLGEVRLGLLASLRYNNSWDTSEELRRTYLVDGGQLRVNNDLNVTRTQQDIELSGFLNLSAELGEDHDIFATSLLARVTEDEAQISEGISDSQPVRNSRLIWEENQLRTSQLGGRHRWSWLGGLESDWIYSTSEASRYAPNTVNYRYDLNPSTGVPVLRTNSQRFDDLVDNADSLSLHLRYPLELFSGALDLKLIAGASRLERDRDNDSRVFQFDLRPSVSNLLSLPLEAILQPDLIGNGIDFRESTLPTDIYLATQEVDAEYLGVDADVFDKYRIAAGVRRESNAQFVTPVPPDGSDPRPDQIAAIEEAKNLPFVNLTWEYSDNGQLRAGYSKTQSRPDFRELSVAPFLDPQLDIISRGNPNLVTTGIENYDLRWEYYYSASESVSAALFRKDFSNPIERTLLTGGSGQTGTFENAESATLDGIELDIYKQLGFVAAWNWIHTLRLGWVDWENVYVSANYARIRSEIGLSSCGDSGAQTNCERPLEGQSPYVVNVQLGYIHPDEGREYSLLFNRFGERIAQVGVAGADDVYEQPFDQLDLVFSQRLGAGFSIKFRLKNLLDPKASFTQEGLPTREYRKGREVLLSLEWKP